jgi:hypothetical protein
MHFGLTELPRDDLYLQSVTSSAADAGPGVMPAVLHALARGTLDPPPLVDRVLVGKTPSLPLPDAGERPVVVRRSWVMRRSLMGHADLAPVARSCGCECLDD